MATGEVRSVYGDYPEIEFVSIFYAIMDSPLTIWNKQERGGLIRRVVDDRDRYSSLGLFAGGNIYPTYITSPCSPFTTLGITLPHVVFVVKNINRTFAFAIQIRDEVCKRRFLFSNAYRTSRIKTFTSHIPVQLGKGWNELTLDLASLTQKAYGTTYKETIRVQVHANCHLRMIYFSAESIQTLEAVEMMRGIVNNLKDTADENGFQPPPSASSPSSTPSSFTVLLISPNSKSGPPPRNHAYVDTFLTLQEQLEAAHARNADLPGASAHEGSKSCPQLGFDMEVEMRKIIQEKLLGLGLEKHTEQEKMKDSVDMSETPKTDLELSEAPYSVKMMPGIGSNPEGQNSVDDLVAHDETSPEDQIVEVEQVEAEQSGGNVTEGTVSPPTEVVMELSRKSKGSILDLDVQLSELEFVVKGMLQSCPNFNSSTLSTSSGVFSRSSRTHSSMTNMQARIDEMKAKLNKLEECFQSTQNELQLTGDASQLPTTPNISPPETSDLNIPDTEPLILNVTSGILRPELARTSFPKLKRNVSVRFATISEVDKEDQNDTAPDSKDNAVPEGTINPPSLLSSISPSERPLTK